MVTGAGRGLGRTIAEELGREGATVVVNYANSKGPAEEVVSNLQQGGSKDSMAVQADVSDAKEAAALIEQTIERGNFEELADLGHWLKGASGNCGFSQISTAGMKLEETARNHDRTASNQTLRELREMKDRIVVQEPDFAASGV